MFDRNYYRSLPEEELVQHVHDDPKATEREIALANALEDMLANQPKS